MGNDDEDEETETETEGETEEYMGKFEDKDYEGMIDTLCNLQEKACIPSSWILHDSQ